MNIKFKQNHSIYKNISCEHKNVRHTIAHEIFRSPNAVYDEVNLPPNVSHSLKKGEIFLVNKTRYSASEKWAENISNLTNNISEISNIQKILFAQNLINYFPENKDILNVKIDFIKKIYENNITLLNGMSIDDFNRTLLTKLYAAIVTYGISSNNRYLPPPINNKVLNQVAQEYTNVSIPSLLIQRIKFLFGKNPGNIDELAKELSQKYSSALVNYQLTKIFTDKKYSKINVYDMFGSTIEKNEQEYENLNNRKGIWIQIPKRRKDKQHPGQNISVLESLSSHNWCTRSRLDKAEDFLREGDFFIYLEKKSDNFEAQIGMPSYNGCITQIQGQANDGYIPSKYLNIIKSFLHKQNLPLTNDYTKEGPSSKIQIAICEKLNEEFNGISLSEALKIFDREIIKKILIDKISLEEKNQESFILIKKPDVYAKLIDFGLTDKKILQLK